LDIWKGGSDACAGAVTLDAGTYPSSQVEYLWYNLSGRAYLASKIFDSIIALAKLGLGMRF